MQDPSTSELLRELENNKSKSCKDVDFTITGDYGRVNIIPDSKSLFKFLIFLEKIFSFVLNKFIR